MLRIFNLLIIFTFMFSGCATNTVQNARSGLPDGQQTALKKTGVEKALELPAVELDKDLLFQLLRADFAVKSGHYTSAVNDYLALAQQTRDPRLAATATRVAIFARKNEQILAGAKLWAELDEENVEARQALVVGYIRKGDSDEALKHLEALFNLEHGELDKKFMMVAALLSREKDIQTALQAMKQFVELRKKQPEAAYAYAHLAIRAGSLDTALAAIKHALELRPDWSIAMLMNARILQMQNKPEDALAYMKGMVRRYPEYLNLRLSYARLLIDTKQIEKAIPHYEAVLKKTPDNVEVVFTMGLLNLQLDRLDLAENYLKRAQKLGKGSVEVHYYLGQLEELRKNYKAAIDHYSAVGRSENYMESRVRIAVITAQLGDLAGAREQLNSLRSEAHVDQARLYLIEGEILRDAKLNEDALQVYNEAIVVFPDNIRLRYSRSTVAEKLDKIDIVEKDLRHILKLESDNVDALNSLGYTLADRTDRYQEAYALIKRAYEINPNDNAIIDSMGWVLYRLGKYQEAIEYLKRSLEMKADPEVAAHLGEVLWVMGQQQEAREVWEQAIKQSPEDRFLLNVMKKFGQ
ncbi:MAG: tetratricopeptide repeat protein [Gammaproteobacteria bacterium]